MVISQQKPMERNWLFYDPQALLIGQTKELLRLNIPRQFSGDCLSLSDYFLSMEEQEFDVLPIQNRNGWETGH